MIKRVCLLTYYNWYETNRYNIRKLALAMQRNGIETKIFDVRLLSEEDLRVMTSFQPDFTLSFNSTKPIQPGVYWWDQVAIPHLFVLLDPPLFYSPFMTASPYLMLSCVDRHDCQTVKSRGFEKVFFMPHAVDRELAQETNEERIFDVVFIGTCHDYESVQEFCKERFPSAIQKIINDAVDIVFSDETVPLDRALIQSRKAHEHHLDKKDLLNFPGLYYFVDRITRGRDRIKLIRSIKNARVHLFGRMASKEIDPMGKKGWAEYFADQPNVTVHPPVSVADSIDILRRSKIVLNSMPFFRDGSHERIFMSLACGAMPLTSESRYLREEFVEGEEILFYQAKKRQEINDLVDHWLKDEDRRKAGVEKGRNKVRQRHTWDNRVQTMQEHIPAFLDKIQYKPNS